MREYADAGCGGPNIPPLSQVKRGRKGRRDHRVPQAYEVPPARPDTGDLTERLGKPDHGGTSDQLVCEE